MINIFAQYSFGGYKIFRLSEESVAEVTSTNRLGLPDSAIQLFSHYGVKLLAAEDMSGNYILFVNDIPCKDKDDMGRTKTCSLAIIGTSMSDVATIRRLAVMIAFELVQFETFFGDLFSVSESLNFDYQRFDEFVKAVQKEDAVSQDRLRNEMSHRNNPIVIYTTARPESAVSPLYRNFSKGHLLKPFLLKWNDNSKILENSVIDRLCVRTLLYKIIKKLTAIWKN